MPPRPTKPKITDVSELTREWIEVEFNTRGYDSDMARSSTIGIANLMKKYMELKGLKTSRATTNGEKWKLIVQDCVPSEMYQADPSNYKGFPMRFWLRWDFLTNKFLDPTTFVHGHPFHFTVACILMYYGHRFSHELYTQPLPPLFPIPCSKFPGQMPCDVLKKVQNLTYDGMDDLYRVMTTMFVAYCVKFTTRLLLPFKP